jgi:F0F1-type ATP synthase assembly protein I
MNKEKSHNPKKQLDQFVKYSSLAFEMAAIMGIGVFAGHQIDQWLALKFPIFTLILMILAVVGAIYHVIRKFL